MRDPEREPSRFPARAIGLGAAAVGTLVVAALAATSSWGPFMTVLPRDPMPVPTLSMPSQSPVPEESLPPELRDAGEPIAWSDWIGELVTALAVAAAIGVVVWFVVALLRALQRPERRRAAEASGTAVDVPEIDEDDVAESLGATLSSLRSGVDVGDAVVECWRRLERVAEDSGIVRRPSQTSEEFTVDILANASVDRADLAALASLYRRAQFSQHVLSDADRDAAIACVERLASQLGAPT